MPPTDAPVQPGADSKAPVDAMHSKLATALTDVYKLDVQPQSLQPVAHQSPVTPELSHVMSKPGNEQDFQDMVAGWKGRPRTEPSGNFLKILKNKLLKRNPDKDLEVVK